eukprot:CAMPEP_0176472448 /NCGR_PEP_ID=MMETSP0127-20121128/41747_1 /TAXON_ID=938130 /ORGANISM="Platyophrya macrostoma, Strain WH" /LENGTH=411 /DNA_ID=CAMNT_0017867315 /DNA_START=75 /DNA_END=1310 /DNA_ORIENTATION=-
MSYVDKLSGNYDTRNVTSKDSEYSPLKTNKPFDPVMNGVRVKAITGPLRRKQNMSLDNYVDAVEAEKWMEVKHAAKLLNITENELHSLTPQQIEERWAKEYRQRTFSQQQELIIAAEVLLEYLDSQMFIKKSRQYYKDYIDNARSAIDNEIQTRREAWKQNLWLFSGVMVFGGCIVVLTAAYLRGMIQKQDILEIGASASDYMGVVLTKPKNREPAPDYGTRYLQTPTEVDLDASEGPIERRLADPDLIRHLKEKAAADEYEDASIVRLVNEENARMERERKERALLESTVVIHRKEDYDEHGVYRPQPKSSQQGTAAEGNASGFRAPSFTEYMDMAKHTFGGSKTQRFLKNSGEHAAEVSAMEQRLRMVNPDVENQQYLSSSTGDEGGRAALEAVASAALTGGVSSKSSA